jgi:hypothetical protein
VFCSTATLFPPIKMNMIATNLSPMSRSAMSEDSLNLSFPAHAESHRLLTQLQSRHPAGTLITELAHASPGLFVVRALVQVGHSTIATGLASAETVEAAEDQARVRALALLGISPAGMVPSTLAPKFEVPVPQLMPEPIPEPVPEIVDATPEPAPAIEEFVLPPVEEFVPEAKSAPKKTSRKKKEESSSVDELLSFAPLDLPEPEPMPPAPEVNYFQDDSEYEVEELEKEPDFPLEDPIDLSDAIAQIGTEIERIGWTKKQGSTYLQQTYDKKTRAELSEDELLEFLHYLKALPSKGHPSLSLPF